MVCLVGVAFFISAWNGDGGQSGERASDYMETCLMRMKNVRPIVIEESDL